MEAMVVFWWRLFGGGEAYQQLRGSRIGRERLGMWPVSKNFRIASRPIRGGNKALVRPELAPPILRGGRLE